MGNIVPINASGEDGLNNTKLALSETFRNMKCRTGSFFTFDHSGSINREQYDLVQRGGISRKALVTE